MKPNLNSQSGQGLTEYLILVVVIAIVSIGVVTQVGTAMRGKFRDVRVKINSISVNEEGQKGNGGENGDESGGKSAE